jgi:hypothetical protein
MDAGNGTEPSIGNRGIARLARRGQRVDWREREHANFGNSKVLKHGKGAAMNEHIPIGTNRTGTQMSPIASKRMQTAPPESEALLASADASALNAIRRSYIDEAEPLGSVPPPLTIKGAVTTGISMISGNQPQLLLDKLGERLAFERSGTRLYDALIAKAEALDGADQPSAMTMTVDDLQQIREDEARHFHLLVRAIESIGGDPTVQTPCADLAGVESIGLMQVMTDPRTTIAQSLHADMAADFSLALDEERRHLAQIQGWYEEVTVGAPISEQVADPDSVSPPLH